MELELSRVDYTLVGLTSLDCMKLLPSDFLKDGQKVVIADKDGILQVFSIKKEDILLVFKTLPGPEISCLKLGGAIGNPTDKIFIASENEVRGYSKKGKLFLTFDSGMTEAITSMYVLGNDLFLCGKHIYNHYRDCKEIDSYLCGDTIVDVMALYQEKTHRLISLLACEGRMVRSIEHGRVTLSMEVDCAPTILYMLEEEEGKTILFGTVDGRVGILDLQNLQGFEKWLIQNDRNSSSISCIDSYDLTGDGNKNLIIGRQDGAVEVYNINVKENVDSSMLIFVENCNESVTSLQCGILNTQGHNEILVSTYTGRIFGLTTEKVDKNVERDSTGENYIYSADTSHKILKLKNEIQDLQHKVSKERDKYQTSTQSFFDEYSAIPLLAVKDSFTLCKESATYSLTIEAPTAIDNILLQSNVGIDLLDVEKNTAVMSKSDADPENGNLLLVTYRCQVNTNRLEIKIRTIEGQHGILQAYVTPLVQPKCSRVRKYDIKPLSLYYRIHNFDNTADLNILNIRGTFSLAEMHLWIFNSLPEVPEKPQVNENNILNFQSSSLGTILQCSYQKGEATIKSNNVSTISILKEFLSKEATKKKIKVDFNISINDQTINTVIKLIEPILIDQQKHSKDIILLEALHELEVTEEETLNCLSSKYKQLLLKEKMIKSNSMYQSGYLDRLYGTICDLFLDYNKFKGINAKSKLPKLLEALENFNYEELLLFIRPDS